MSVVNLWEAAQSLREAQVIRISILHAFKPGDVLVLETDRQYTREQLRDTRERLRALIDETGVKIILLDAGMHVVTREEHTSAGAGA